MQRHLTRRSDITSEHSVVRYPSISWVVVAASSHGRHHGQEQAGYIQRSGLMATTHLPTRLTTTAGGLLQALRRHPLVGYFGLAFGLTWLYELALIMRPGLPF